MKKLLKYFVPIFCLSFILVSCGKDKSVDNSTMNIEVNYTNATLETGTIEETVDNIYDSVVAINSFVNQKLYGSGSGVLFAKSETHSFIITCHHVIADCDSFQVTLNDSSVLNASLIGGDALSDIAVLAVEQVGLTYASWYENTDLLKLGSSVICIGNPLGTLPGSVSTGVVSYLNRSIVVDNYHKMDLIQTDVAINSGNSGGGLFNAAGALIGIVNAKYSSEGIEGLGFAIPANMAKTIADSLLKTAGYDQTTKTWTTGYVKGRWSIGMTLGYGGGFFNPTVIGVSGVASNETESDYGKLQVNDVISSITIDYADGSKEDLVLSNITAYTTVEGIYQFLYQNEATLGDQFIFEISRNNQNIKVEIPLIQYRYSI